VDSVLSTKSKNLVQV